MSFRPYVAELLGTFVLALFVSLATVNTSSFPAALAAPLVLAFFVYTVGWVSGAHLNPAVTIGLASIKKISVPDAVYYVLAQFLGAILAMVVSKLMFGQSASVGAADSVRIVVGEAMGAFLLAWAVLSAVEKKVHVGASGLVVGMGLLLGILVAMGVGTNGVINPAVAFGVGSFSFSYLLGPILGGLAAAWGYRALAEPKPEPVPMH